MGTQQLTEKEQNLLILCLVKECIKFAEDNSKSFELVLNEDVFLHKASTEFAEAVCKRIVILKNEGYIDGTVELAYNMEYDLDADEDTPTDDIELDMCTFSNISISLKGNISLGIEGFKEVSKDFAQKAKPVISCIATTALQTAVEVAITAGMKAIGFPV